MNVPDKPSFTCQRCSSLLCDDCASVAAEYEYLHQARALALQRVQEDLLLANERIAELERQLRNWQEVAKIGYPALMTAWIDDQMEDARKKGRANARKGLKASGFLDRMRKLEKLAKETT